MREFYKYIMISLVFLSIPSSISAKDSITVYLFLAEDCKICQYYTPLLHNLYEQYSLERIGWVGFFPNRYSNEESIQTFKEKFDIPFPLKREFYQTKTKALRATITPEVVVYNEDTNRIIYQGRIDNSYYRLGRRRQVTTSHELRDVLEALRKGKIPKVNNQPPIGCYIMAN